MNLKDDKVVEWVQVELISHVQPQSTISRVLELGCLIAIVTSNKTTTANLPQLAEDKEGYLTDTSLTSAHTVAIQDPKQASNNPPPKINHLRQWRRLAFAMRCNGPQNQFLSLFPASLVMKRRCHVQSIYTLHEVLIISQCAPLGTRRFAYKSLTVVP